MLKLILILQGKSNHNEIQFPIDPGILMKNIVNLLFEARILKELPRSGYHFLGAGKESVAEHSFMITFIAYLMSEMEDGIDAQKLISMCLIHDLPEARTGDLNYVQKKYAATDEPKAIKDAFSPLPFGRKMKKLMEEFNLGKSREALLAKDADQLAFIIDLKALSDIGYKPPEKWLPIINKRLKTRLGKKIARMIMETSWDEWWLKNYVDIPDKNK